MSYDTVRGWLRRDDLHPKVHSRRHRKVYRALLAQHVKEYPHAKLSERAAYFNVHINPIWYQLKQMKVVKKQLKIFGTQLYENN